MHSNADVIGYGAILWFATVVVAFIFSLLTSANHNQMTSYQENICHSYCVGSGQEAGALTHYQVCICGSPVETAQQARP